jgi:hypothetical protein
LDIASLLMPEPLPAIGNYGEIRLFDQEYASQNMRHISPAYRAARLVLSSFCIRACPDGRPLLQRMCAKRARPARLIGHNPETSILRQSS